MINSNCGRPRVLRAASVMAVVALELAVAPAAHANDWTMMDGATVLLLLIVFVLVPLVVYAAVVVLAGWLALRAAARSARPRENKWAAWSLILGLVSLPLWAVGPFAIWTGITAYRMGGSKRTAVVGIVLGAVGTVLLLVLVGELLTDFGIVI